MTHSKEHTNSIIHLKRSALEGKSECKKNTSVKLRFEEKSHTTTLNLHLKLAMN